MGLSIFIATYNRASLLGNVLTALSNSVFNTYSITVLNNCSTDNTIEVANSFTDKLPRLSVISNSVNIGADANMLRAMDLSKEDYTWILCDDDYYDFSGVEDVITMIDQKQVDLIHVGAHPEKNWGKFGGRCDTPRNLFAEGYPYFKFSSFIACNIFKTKVYTDDFLIKGYRNIVNCYPFMPFFIGEFQNDKKIYVSKSQIVTARCESDNYKPLDLWYWWIGTCSLLTDKIDVRNAFFDQWREIDAPPNNWGLETLQLLLREGQDQLLIERFIADYCNDEDKAYLFYKVKLSTRIKNGIWRRFRV